MTYRPAHWMTLADGTEIDTLKLPKGQRICYFCMHLHPVDRIYFGVITAQDRRDFYGGPRVVQEDGSITVLPRSEPEEERIRCAARVPACLGCDHHEIPEGTPSDGNPAPGAGAVSAGTG